MLKGLGPRTSVKEENDTDVKKILDGDRRVIYFQIKESLELNLLTIYLILKDDLNIIKH